jgi:hypothetical protein
MANACSANTRSFVSTYKVIEIRRAYVTSSEIWVN